MSLPELELAVMQLSSAELASFAQWFEEFWANEWDRQIECDIQAGKLDKTGCRADGDFDAGQSKPL